MENVKKLLEVSAEDVVPRVVGGNLESAGIAFKDMKVGSVEEF